MSRAHQARLPLACIAQPSRQTQLLRDALRALETAHGKGYANPRIALTADEQAAIESALAEGRRRFGIPPHRSVSAFTFELHGICIRMWFHEDGHLYLLNNHGRRLFAFLDLWA